LGGHLPIGLMCVFNADMGEVIGLRRAIDHNSCLRPELSVLPGVYPVADNASPMPAL
jgi:hypothetical protein